MLNLSQITLMRENGVICLSGNMSFWSRHNLETLPHLCTKNETMAPLGVVPLTESCESMGSLPYLCIKNYTIAPLHVVPHTVKR